MQTELPVLATPVPKIAVICVVMLMDTIPKEYNKKIDAVLDFIAKNIRADLSLGKLATIANFSPFYFQRIFKAVIGESPKQYIIRIKLETAAHYLIVHQDKSIKEISLDCGFSSPAIFARAFRDYFGITAEALKNIPMKERLDLYLKGKQINTSDTAGSSRPSLKIVIKTIPGFRGIFHNTDLMNVSGIQATFNRLIQVADRHDLITRHTNYIGLIHPNQHLYRCLVSLDSHRQVPRGMQTREIVPGKYATYKFQGGLGALFEAMRNFATYWLPDSGYRMADIFCFEILPGTIAGNNYSETERELYFPIEPV